MLLYRYIKVFILFLITNIILGRKTIQLITSYKIKYNEFENSIKDLNYTNNWRSKEQVLSLSVYREGVKMSIYHCPKNTCVLSNSVSISNSTYATIQSFQNKKNEKNMVGGGYKNLVYVPISVRLIDFCTNLMANENTCHHR
jgi:hypothetical protein